MSGIRVFTKRPTEKGRIYPRYDVEADILSVETHVDCQWKFGVNVDGTIVFDLDNDRVLVNFDVHVPRRLWRKARDITWPKTAKSHDIVFSEEAVIQHVFSLPVTVNVTNSLDQVRIDIGTGCVDYFVSLSDQCVGLLGAGELKGFLLRGCFT